MWHWVQAVRSRPAHRRARAQPLRWLLYHLVWVAIFPFLLGCQPAQNQTPTRAENESGTNLIEQRNVTPSDRSAAPGEVEKRSLRIAAASDLRHVFGSLSKAYQLRNPDVELVPIFGSSGQLAAQLHERAPFDLFLAADIDYAQRIATLDEQSDTQVFAYARGYVGLWWPAKTPSEVVAAGPRGLLADTVRRIAIANPRHAPYGRAAETSLRNLELLDSVAPRFVIAENVAQAGQFVASGAADVGLIAKSLALSSALRDRGEFQELPIDSYPPLIQGGVVVPWSKQREEAREFQQFLLSPEARVILQSAGFGDVDAAAHLTP